VTLPAQERGAARAGPLHGWTVGVKDLVDVAGLPTRAGSPVLDDAAPAAADAPIVAALRAAGAVVMGKTATHEWAFGVTTRRTRNPWGPDRVAGGSSGGSAVAVATGDCQLAVGSDTAGSVRIPAALCGVAGIKFRAGAVPMDGVVPLAPSLDSLGLLAASAADLAAAWAALTGDGPVPASSPATALVPAAEALGPLHPAQAAALASAAARFGAREVSLPSFGAWSRPRGVKIRAEALAVHRAAGWWPAAADRYDGAIRAELEKAERQPATELDAACAELGALAAALRTALAPGAVLMLPTTPGPAPSREIDDRAAAAELTRLCGPVNECDLAAVSLPCGLADGLPLGLQLVAEREEDALAAALAWEAIVPPPRR
jgi:aspartyl-tRNA(Asn)/glutamyl-tRNA(Gln) amidotransferase subunit A